MRMLRRNRALSLTALVLSAMMGLGLLWHGRSWAATRDTVPSPGLPPGYVEPEIGFMDRVMFFGNVNAYFTVSDRAGSGSIGGGGLGMVLAPGYRLTDNTAFTLLYNGSYYRKMEFYSDEVGPLGRSERLQNTITPMFRVNFGHRQRYSVTTSLFYTETKNKDVEGGGWSDGLYNYRDKGAGLDFGVRRLGVSDTGSGRLKLGVQVYDREYPNYHSLLDLATDDQSVLGTEKDERDYLGILCRASYTWAGRTGLSWGTNYYLLIKRLEDKKVVDSNGILTSEEQRDYLHNLTLRFSYRPEEAPVFLFGLDFEGTMNDSNQNYYDGMGTLSLSDDVPIEDFYDYRSLAITPKVSYTFSALPVTLKLSYRYMYTRYTERLAQYPDGTYKRDKQFEIQNEFRIGFWYEPIRDLHLYAEWEYLSVDSNNDYRRVYSYSYIVNYYSVGVSYSF